jgi:hypothetical protein
VAGEPGLDVSHLGRRHDLDQAGWRRPCPAQPVQGMKRAATVNGSRSARHEDGFPMPPAMKTRWGRCRLNRARRGVNHVPGLLLTMSPSGQHCSIDFLGVQS